MIILWLFLAWLFGVGCGVLILGMLLITAEAEGERPYDEP